ncbi:MAG: ferrochelatase [Candidatus Cloacimonetes bacterium]|nr:ferrochelatase [Candidatus Cloacimonadota bacterium]
MHKNILILNFGGPQNASEVQPFLKELFSDTVGIKFGIPGFLQKLLARFISWRRSPGIIEKYQEIGGGSPLVPMTSKLIELLSEKLPGYRFFTAMRYTPPFAEDTLREMKDLGVHEAMVLPLYPHYSIATVETSMDSLKQAMKKLNYYPVLRPLCSWYEFDDYIGAMVHQVRLGLQKFDKKPLLLFSAHGVPVSYIEEGDPYFEHVEHSVRLILDKLEWDGEHKLAWQSRVGPVKWLEPSMDDMLLQLGKEQKHQVLVIPVSFVGDHIETLHEIDIEYAHLAKEAGITEFKRMPSLNTEPVFVDCLKNLIETKYDIHKCSLKVCRCFLYQKLSHSN